MTDKELQHISNVLEWYEGTDGSEREDAAYDMYVVLKDIYNKLKNKIQI